MSGAGGPGPTGVIGTAPAVLQPADRPGAMRRVSIVVLALAAGALVVSLARFGPVLQSAIVFGVGLGIPLLMLFLARPYIALAAYLLVLPLIIEVPIVAGLNAGELLTFLIMLLGVSTLWGVRDRLGHTLARMRPILLPLAALTVVSLVSLMVNQIFRFEEVLSALFKIVAFGLMPVLVHVHLRGPEQARRTMTALLMGGAAVALYTITSYLMGWSYSAEYDWNRPVGTFEHWNLLGGFMALVSLPTLGLAGVSRGWRRITLVLLFGLEIGVLLLSLTLGSMAGVLVGATLVLLFLMRPRWTRLLPVLLVAAVAVGVAFASDPLLREKVTRIDERLDDRLRTYATGVSMFRDKFLWGFGSEQNVADEILLGKADYGITIFGPSSVIPHNALLKISVEKGVFGLVTFAALILGALYVLLRHRHRFKRDRHAVLYFGLVAGVLAFLVQNVTNDLLLHARLGILFFSLIAIVDRLAPGETKA